MSRTYIAKELREKVTADARRRCGYCQTQEVVVVGVPMEIDHIIPEALGGVTERENLWLACSLCNDHKSDRIYATDPLTGDQVRLYNPRQEVWRDHFRWNIHSDQIVGLSPTGRVTVLVLQLNRPSLVKARQLWAAVGWHPPAD